MNTNFVPSAQQTAIFENVRGERGHTVVVARAGTGKTTTILKAMEHLPGPVQSDSLMVAFNKSIAKELEQRAPRGVTVSTLHSYGLRQISRAISPRPQIDEDKLRPILQEVVGNQDSKKEERLAVKRLVSLSKATLAKTDEAVDELIDRFGVELPQTETEEDASEIRAKIVAETREAVNQSCEIQNVIDFDDMIYFPCVFKMSCQPFARVFIDETQDLNESQIKLALKACDKRGRILAVGDDRQAIYGFRGAAEGAVDAVIDRLAAKTLKLTITRRCPKSVVALAAQYVPDFEASPDAPEGSVSTISLGSKDFNPQPGDFVLSRTNAPLVKLCFALLREGVRANIQGRDIGARLRSVVAKTHANTVSELAVKVSAWRDREVARLDALDRDPSSVIDTAECINALSDGASSVDEVLGRIDRLFSDSGGGDSSRVILSTTHKAKGLERDHVWVLRSTYLRRDTQEEQNLFYVAVTRTKRDLILVRDYEQEERDEARANRTY
jgi:superfamily I DNA/RNA helicase